jgi:hypothetical protein
MLGSAVSGLVARVPCHGLDTLKARVQQGSSGGVLGTLSTLLRVEGVRGLYRGFGVAMVGSLPGSCLYFTTYEVVKGHLAPFLPAVGGHLCAGLAAEAVSCVLFVPVDVVKERMQVQSPGERVYYHNARDAVRQIVGSGEGLGGLYRGYGATLASFGPFSALYFALYEWLKEGAMGGAGSSSTATTPAPLPLGMQMVVAGTAGAGASLLTNPLDLVKLRLQVQRGGGESTHAHYRGLGHGLTLLVKEEGVKGLFRGAGIRILFHTATTAITVSCFEQCKALADRVLQ